MPFPRSWLLLLVVLAWSGLCLAAQDAEGPLSPHVTSVFPLGGQQGTRVEAEVRGLALDGAYAAWFDGSGLRADIGRVEEVAPPESESGATEGPGGREGGQPGHRVRLRVSIDGSALPGVYALRLISPRGISNPLPFAVGTESVILEAPTPHHRPADAQPVNFPVVIYGRINQPGELDYFSFQARKGQELFFEVFSRPVGVAPNYEHVGSGFDARLGLYEARGSWFDPARVRSLALSDEPVFASIDPNPQLTHRFSDDGHYILEVGVFPGEPPKLGSGGPDHCYLLRIVPPETTSLSERTIKTWRQRLLARSDWREQTFERRLQPDHLIQLHQRSNHADPEEQPSSLSSVQEQEPNESPGEAIQVRPPTVVQGKIQHAGDADHFRFRVVEAGQALVFEIETPVLAPPLFNPWMVVLDEEGREVFTNVYQRVGRWPNYRKTVQPKVVHVFERGGEFSVQIRDITYRHGGPDFQYKLLIRPWIPHIGEIQVNEESKPGAAVPIDRINLIAGVPKKLTVVTGLEEGFAAAVAVGVEGLPEGVKLFPASAPETQPSVLLDEGDRERYLPRTSRAPVVLIANADAVPTETPQSVRFTVRCFAGTGSTLRVHEVPLMVLRHPGGHTNQEVSP